jgi:hypothetical protein
VVFAIWGRGACRGVIAVVTLWSVLSANNALAQGLGGVGTVQGTVTDPTGGVMQSVEVRITNLVTGFARTAMTDATGKYAFTNLAPNPYHVSVEAQGFQPLARDVEVRSGVPVTLDLALALAGTVSSVDVVGHGGDLIERDPTAHTDIDQSLIGRLAIETSSGGLNAVVMLAAPGVVADSNGFFHPIGDHAQTQFSIDNQPITDQQSRVYSNQISPEAVQSLEMITGVPPAEYGDKSSLVVHVVTKSGLDLTRPAGSASFGYGSFQSPNGQLSLGGGSKVVGDFVSLSGLRTERFLDPPEFTAIHDTGHSGSFFNRLDVRPGAAGTFHLNVQAAKSGFDIPNTYDQIAQTQHQDVKTFNIAPGYSQALGDHALFTVNGYARRDQSMYLPSTDPFDDTPATISQNRSLANFGGKGDVTITTGRHNVKFGGSIAATKLHEQFTFGITDPTDEAFLDESGQLNPSLQPFDLTSPGGGLLNYDQLVTIKQQAAYVQDDIRAGNATFKLGVRVDHYDGLTEKSLVQPRLGVSYAVAGSGTVVRASYGRTMETPYNENLLLSAGYRLNGLFGAGDPVPPGIRNQVEIGIQQAFGRWLVADFGYFNKRTDNGYDFGVLFNTPIAFPVAWDHSRIDGFTGRVNLVEHGGFSAFVVMAHTNAIYSPPGVGGILLEEPGGDFRIDHDQQFNATTNVQYTFEKRTGAWAALSWRYDSGLVSGSVPDYATALSLTADQQAAIGLFCGSASATPSAPITSCSSADRGALRLVIPADGTVDDVTNPPRVAPRHLLDFGVGIDNVLRTDRTRLRLRFSVLNLTNKEALYNFLSTFSGTHFVTPRAYQVQLGVTF